MTAGGMVQCCYASNDDNINGELCESGREKMGYYSMNNTVCLHFCCGVIGNSV